MYFPPNRVKVIKSTRLKQTAHVTRMEVDRSALKVLSGNPTGNRPIERPRLGWEDNIRMDLKEIVINKRNWVDSAQDRDYWRVLVNAALNLWVPYTMESFS